MFRLFECCALSFFERFVLSFSLKIERFVSDSAEIWICGLYFQCGILRNQSLCHDTLHIKGEYILSLTCTRFGSILGNAGNNSFLLGSRSHDKLVVCGKSSNIFYCGSCTTICLIRSCCNIGGKGTLVKQQCHGLRTGIRLPWSNLECTGCLRFPKFACFISYRS